MKIEVLIYIYAGVCAGMIVFNCVTILVNKRRNRKLKKRNRRLEPKIQEQIERIRQGKEVEDEHKKWLFRRLKRIGNLMALDDTLEHFAQENEASLTRYLETVYPVLVQTAEYYKKKDVMEITYFSYLVRKYHLAAMDKADRMTELMLTLLSVPSLYCRENALQVLYDSGECECVIRALKKIDGMDIFHHSKLLQDGLLKFTGDREELIEKLWEVFPGFSCQMQVTILNFVRLVSGKWKEKVYQLLTADGQDDEVSFACIRYFNSYPYETAHPILLDFVDGKRKNRWEYAAIAATALGNYKSPQTEEVLVRALSSRNWYVRYNAAQSLEKLGVYYADLIEVFEGGDKYAREILQYWLDCREVREET